MKRLFLLMLMSVLFVVVQPTNTFALSCATLLGVEEAYEKYDGVVVGQVDDVVQKTNNNEVELTVMQSFKGVEDATLTVKENITWGALMGSSEVGEKYLFFLSQTDGEWENPLCAPTVKVAGAAAELEYLKEKEILIPNPGNADNGSGTLLEPVIASSTEADDQETLIDHSSLQELEENSKVRLYMGILAVAAGGIVGIVYRRKRSSKRN